ncbi:hypothetical protein PENTCL1PPCAC_10333, partial [Pristionchus entomophagus]
GTASPAAMSILRLMQGGADKTQFVTVASAAPKQVAKVKATPLTAVKSSGPISTKGASLPVTARSGQPERAVYAWMSWKSCETLPVYKWKSKLERQYLTMDEMTIKNGGRMTIAELYNAFLPLHDLMDNASMVRLNKYYNSYLDPEVLDLQFLPAGDRGLAIPMLEKIILEIAAKDGKRPKAELIVVTGRGKRNKNASSRKVGRIRMEVEK